MGIFQIVEGETESDKVMGAEVTNSTHSTSTKAKESKAKLCEVCKEQPAKYKSTHPAVEAESSSAVSPINEVTPLRAQTSAFIPLAGTVAGSASKGPFAALENSRELESLFELYPSLHAQLEEINAAMHRPLDNQNTNNRQTYGFRKPKGIEQWDQDRGMENGMKALQRARSVYGKEGEAVREYSKLVLRILSSEEGSGASEIVQREVDEENARVIQQLLQIEKR
ncbi:hypothetical protein ACMFMG_011838 [Clarireedia jacksonii]